jgi:hypothetical protein
LLAPRFSAEPGPNARLARISPHRAGEAVMVEIDAASSRAGRRSRCRLRTTSATCSTRTGVPIVLSDLRLLRPFPVVTDELHFTRDEKTETTKRAD